MRIEIQRSIDGAKLFKVAAVEGQAVSILYEGLPTFAAARDKAMSVSQFHGGAPIIDCVGERRHAPAGGITLTPGAQSPTGDPTYRGTTSNPAPAAT